MMGVRFLLLLSCFVLCTSAQDEELTTGEEVITASTPETIPQNDFIECTEAHRNYSSMRDPKIVGGEVVQNREDFSYQASLRYIKKNFPFCGGTIISETHILTAAHCLVTSKGGVISKNAIYIVVGDLRTDLATPSSRAKNVLYVMVHEKYSTTTLQNDIALLKIDTLGEFNPYINKIELSISTPPEGTVCIVSGWGTLSAGGEASSSLRSVEVPIASFEVCSNSYFEQLYDGMMCAGYVEGQRDACQGDSGGPLVCNDVLAGVVSWGFSCAQPDFPGIYTDVSKYLDWIEEHKAFQESVAERPKHLVIKEYIVQNRGDFAYQASLRYTSPNYHFCGATIIDKEYVLTAAHCVMDKDTNEIVKPSSLSIAAGDLNLREETDTTVYRNVLEIYVHENFQPSSLENDIALLKVSEFDEWSVNINKVALATATPSEGAICTSSGWGAVSVHTNYSDTLYFVNIPILATSICTIYYQNSFREGMICAGDIHGRKIICQEDSGGPLICNYKLVGIVSWGYNCTEPGYPSVYTNVAAYYNWVETKLSRSSTRKNTANLSAMIAILVISLLFK